MGINKEMANKAELIAREISIERTGNDSLWEIFLTEVYEDLIEKIKNEDN